jgi:hypothetical protein
MTDFLQQTAFFITVYDNDGIFCVKKGFGEKLLTQ